MEFKNTDQEVLDPLTLPQHPIECEAPNDQMVGESTFRSNIKYMVVGIMFGIVFVKAEIISWYRIQEMFLMHSFHMYGVIGTAVVVGMLSVWLIKKYKIRTVRDEEVVFHKKEFHWGNIIGATMFGLGWAITGACPGPLFAQIGSGFLAVIITLLSAIAGTWVYGAIREKLPH
ncbi:MAG TPA: YeeE/YedE thiosulfate transporter family protein [Cyclobacteriaceae bacterium]|nr:YeeE/YedE thiosulfate transporter family protein [Cyclobacteriaceae bacterium]